MLRMVIYIPQNKFGSLIRLTKSWGKKVTLNLKLGNS